MLAAAFAMLVSTGQLDVITTTSYALALCAGFLFDFKALSPLSRKLANWLRFGYLPLFIFDWYVLGSSPALAVIRYVLFASACKFLSTRTHRDWLWLYLIAFFEVVLSAGMMVSATFFVLLLIFVFFAICALATFEMRRSTEDSAPEGARFEFWRDVKGMRRTVGAPRSRIIAIFSCIALALILILAAPLFVAMPRLNRSPAGGRLLRTEALSGFSTTVRLGEVAQVKLNPRVVMRVRVRFPVTQGLTQMRWRGVTFDEYDGQSWTQTGVELEPLRRLGDSYQVERVQLPGPLTTQSFVLEPLDPPTVFAAVRPIYIRDLPIVRRDGGDGLWTEAHASQRLSYTVFSYTRTPTDAELATDTSRIYPPDIRRRYLQQPVVRDRRMDELAEEVTRGAINTIDIARRIEQHLRTSYEYSLDLSRIGDVDPLADFLFDVKAGHCEFFATAMVMLLRARRIPARLVNGFQMGEYSDLSDSFTVRQSDAHSWVEVYFNQYGWVAFDPTPPAGLSNYDSGFVAQLRKYFEGLEMFWQERIVGFGPGEQLAMLASFQQNLSNLERGTARGFIDWVSGVGKSVVSMVAGRSDNNTEDASGEDAQAQTQPQSRVAAILEHPFLIGFIFAIAAALAVYEWRRYSHSWRRLARRNGRSSAVAFYHEMSRILERRGLRREPSLTPREFAASIGLTEVRELTNAYEHARYSESELSPDEIARVGVLLQQLKRRKPAIPQAN